MLIERSLSMFVLIEREMRKILFVVEESVRKRKKNGCGQLLICVST